MFLLVFKLFFGSKFSVFDCDDVSSPDVEYTGITNIVSNKKFVSREALSVGTTYTLNIFLFFYIKFDLLEVNIDINISCYYSEAREGGEL